jgi:hypothetical protein
MKLCTFRILAALAAVVVASPLYASPMTYIGISGTRAASVTFEVVGGNLQVTLSNTSAADTFVPTDVLTGVFFNVTGNPALGRISGLLSGGSTVFYDADGQPVAGVIGGEWAYLNGLNQYGANSGISSSGLGIFGPGNRFPGTDLEDPASPDGLQYGLLTAGDLAGTGNGGITGSGGLIKNSVVFTLSGFSGLTEADISAVTFQYGTSLDEPHVSGCTTCTRETPEPQTLALVALGTVGLAIARRKRRA